MQQPLVSILIPFKNTVDFLDECLQSICNQTYKNFEVIAVNDHSTDESKLVALTFQKNDARIQVLDNAGNGIIPALQTAYKQSKGQFITRMDADDIMTQNKLKVMVDNLQKHGVRHLAVGQVKYFSSNGISDGYARYETWLNQLTQSGTNYTEIYKECVIPSPCWMAYREDLDLCGAFDSERYPEDYDLAFRFYENRLKCIPSSEMLHYWRDYDHRTSRTSDHYAENSFLEIKLHYFLKLNHVHKRPLVVWGAGTKGKNIAKSLVEKQIDFYWVCDNANKIGKDIYGQKMLHYSALEELKNPQTIITVANRDAQTMIYDFLSGLLQENMQDYFFFC